MKTSKRLKARFFLAMLALFISFSSMVMVTYAWYIYHTGAHTSDIHMAVGAGSSLQISSAYDGVYGNSAVMDEFEGLLNPVSTNRITGGFQKVTGFTNGSENQPRLLASLFGASDSSDYYKTTLFMRSSGEEQKIYLSNIGYEDDDLNNPISTAIRVGLVVHEAGQNKPVNAEYIFAINQAPNPKGEYNTATGQEGYVLDCEKTDGTTVPMNSLYTSDQYCTYDVSTGAVALKPGSLPLFSLKGNNGGYGESVQVDIYIWLEGCDRDCTNNLCSTSLTKLALSFVSSDQ